MKQTNVVERFNPKNATSLKEEDFKDLQDLSPEEIAELAKAYPNQPNGNNYLILEDTSIRDASKQLYPRSTWQNLKALHDAGQKQFKPISYHSVFQGKPGQPLSKPGRDTKVQDLTKEDLSKQEGLNNSGDKGQDGGDNASGGKTGNEASNQAGPVTKADLEQLGKEELKEKYEAATGKAAGRTSRENMIKELVKLSKQ